MSLPLKQRLFVNYYLGKALHNGTQAARLAGFSSPRQMATRLLSKASIQELIEEKVTAVAMDAEEVLARLSRQGRSDMEDFLGPITDPDDPPTFDFKKAKRRDQLGNIKTIERTTKTIPRGDLEPAVEVKIKLQVFDPRPALETLAKFHRLIDGKEEDPAAREIAKAVQDAFSEADTDP